MTRDAKSIRVRCGSWDQVEAFYNEKVLASRGNILVVKMPFRPGIGEAMTVALALPDGLVFAIDGTVVKIGADDHGRVPVAVRLHGLGNEVRAQLKRLVAQGRGQAPSPTTPVGGTRAVGTRPPPSNPPAPARALVETIPPLADPTLRDVAPDEREVFDSLAATRERVSALPAHDVLRVAADTTGENLKSAYLAAAHEVHPDRYRRYRSPGLRLLAADAFVMVRRAYERMAQIEGPARQEGWLLAMPDASETAARDAPADSSGVPTEPLQVSGSAPYSEISITAQAAAAASYEEDVSFTTSVRMRALTAEELFDDEPTPAPAAMPSATSTPVPPPATHPVAPRTEAEELEAAARTALAEGHYREACEGFAAYLRVDPRNRIIRALYHVASGMDLRAKGEGVKARLQFETALAHDRDCEEARRALGQEQPERKTGIFKRLFDK